MLELFAKWRRLLFLQCRWAVCYYDFSSGKNLTNFCSGCFESTFPDLFSYGKYMPASNGNCHLSHSNSKYTEATRDSHWSCWTANCLNMSSAASMKTWYFKPEVGAHIGGWRRRKILSVLCEWLMSSAVWPQPYLSPKKYPKQLTVWYLNCFTNNRS